MTNAKKQFGYTSEILAHVEGKIRGRIGYTNQSIALQQAKIEYLDKLADILNDPEIAQAWDENELPEQPKLIKPSSFPMSIIMGMACFSWVIFSIMYVLNSKGIL